MPILTKVDPTLGTGASVGKYFATVSAIPSAALVAWFYILYVLHFSNSGPDFHGASDRSPANQPYALVLAIAIALAIALITHPLTFAIFQFMEGYWGRSQIGQTLRVRLTLTKLERLQVLQLAREASIETLRAQGVGRATDANTYLNPYSFDRHSVLITPLLRSRIQDEIWSVVRGQHPEELDNVLPTRLGNVMRRHELAAGRAYGLPVLDWATHIGLVSDPSHVAYVNDQRTQLDLAAKMAAFMAVASILSFLSLWQSGAWVVLSIIPWFAAIGSYRGAVSAADSYGRALSAWVDLNRRELYRRLGLPSVTSVAEEREQNRSLQALLLGQPVWESALVDVASNKSADGSGYGEPTPSTTATNSSERAEEEDAHSGG